MGIFFTQTAWQPSMQEAIETALKTDPQNVSDPKLKAAEMSAQVARQTSGRLNWGRLVIAVVLLAAIGWAGVYTAQHNLQEWSKMFLHSFELFLGVAVGLLSGEAAAAARN